MSIPASLEERLTELEVRFAFLEEADAARQVDRNSVRILVAHNRRNASTAERWRAQRLAGRSQPD